jgi:hypothetical protein
MASLSSVPAEIKIKINLLMECTYLLIIIFSGCRSAEDSLRRNKK